MSVTVSDPGSKVSKGGAVPALVGQRRLSLIHPLHHYMLGKGIIRNNQCHGGLGLRKVWRGCSGCLDPCVPSKCWVVTPTRIVRLLGALQAS